MIDAWDAWSAKRAVRLSLVVGTLAVGCATTALLAWQRLFVLAPIFSVASLAALVGSGKQATP